MRSQSLTMILVLCFAIILVDALAFYWLRDITGLIASDFLRNFIHLLFWFFTVGLVSAILILRFRLKRIAVRKRQLFISYLYGLTVSSILPKLIFVVIISVLHATEFVFTPAVSRWLVPLGGLFAGFLPFFVIVYGIFRTLYRFEVKRISLSFESLPVSYHGLRIVQISDLHIGSFNYRYRILERAVHIINKLEPDLLFFTGDLVNNYHWELEGWDKVFRQLRASEGKYAVLGNHDYGDYSDWESADEKRQNFAAITGFYEKVGFNLLRNDAVILRRSGEPLAIIGVENWGRPPFKQYGDLEKAMADVRDTSFKILLSHDPSHWSEEVLTDTDIALTLSGHTHGMQAGVSFGRRQWSPIKYKYKHWSGLYRSGEQCLYVNRGLGWLGFPGRLGMRPEITLIKLKKA